MENTSSTSLLRVAARASPTISRATTAAKTELETPGSSQVVDASLRSGPSGLLATLHWEEDSRSELESGESSE